MRAGRVRSHARRFLPARPLRAGPGRQLRLCAGRVAGGVQALALGVVCLSAVAGAGPQPDGAALRAVGAGRGAGVCGASGAGAAPA